MAFETPNIWDTRTLLDVYRELRPAPNYWLDLLFPNEMLFDSEYIEFEKIPRAGRKLAPFVVPMAQGRAIFEERSQAARFRPAYLKPSDPVSPMRALSRRPGSLLAPGDSTMAARYEAIKSDILQYHRYAVERRWEWMAAQAALNGTVVVDGDDYPAVTVDFGRAAGHTITLGVGARWGDSGVSILDLIQTWADTMHAAAFGGAPTRITVGTSAWAVMRKDTEVVAEMSTQRRGTDVDVKTGLIGTGEVRYVGNLGGGIDVYVYNDYYESAGSAVAIMDPRDVVLTGPAVNGWRCFGAIMDVNAMFQAVPIYARNYVTTGDVAIEQIVTQSAPLMVPVNPNATLRARVLA